MKAVYLTLAIAGACLLASCGTPLTVGVTSDYGTAEYSSKGGLSAHVDASAIARRMAEPPSVRPEK